MSVKSIIYHDLVHKHKDRIYGYAVHLLRNASDAEDVTQDVLLRMWNNLGRFKTLKATSWIMRVTHNTCIDVIRKRESSTHREVLMEPEELEMSLPGSHVMEPSRLADNAMLKVRIDAAIRTLPEQLRSIFVLYELQGLKCAQIADVLEMPVNTVKVYLVRARIHLQKELRDYGPGSTY